MDAIFGLSTSLLAALLAGAVAVAAVVIVLLALRRPVLVRLGVRHIPRRRGRSVLIVVGLALSTTIVAASFGTGDAIAFTVRSLVTGSLGGVDEIVVWYESGTRRLDDADVQGFANGRIPVLAGADFARGEVDRIAGLLDGQQGVAAITGALARQYAVTDATQQTSTAAITTLALPGDAPAAFGTLRRRDGTPAALAELAPGEVYLNEPAAALLSAAEGDEIAIGAPAAEIAAQVRAVIPAGEIGGTQPTLVAELGWFGEADGAPGQINEILIRNAGDGASLEWSAPIALRLRSALVDDATASQIHRLLRSPGLRDGLRDSVERQPDLFRPLLKRLVAELDRDAPTAELKTLIGDPRVLSALRPAVRRLAPEIGHQLRDALEGLSGLTVIELKQLSVDLASQLASVFTSVFLVLGLFSIATGVMLVFLIFALLAADRRPELGMARALGTQRGQLVQLLLFEGALYDVVASALGAAVGLAVALGTLQVIAGYLRTFSFQLAAHVEPRSLVIAFCLGLLLTVATVVVAAWRVARLNVVTAARNLPDEDRARRSWSELLDARQGWHLARAALLRGPATLLIGLGLLVVAAMGRALAVVEGLGWSAVIVACAALAQGILVAAGMHRPAASRLSATLGGLGLVAFWAQPLSDGPRWQAVGVAGSLEYLSLGGLLMVLGAVWVATSNLELLPAVARSLTVRMGRAATAGAVLRIAAAYPARHPWQTALAILMFSLVVFTVTVSSVLLAGTRYAYTDAGVQTAGFDVSAELDPARLADLPSRLPDAEGVGAASFAAVGGQAALATEAIQLGAAAGRWASTDLQVVDDGWLDGIGAPLTQRAPGYATDAAVWAALRAQPGVAVIHGSALPLASSPDAAADLFGSAAFRLQGATREDAQIPASVVWLRNLRGGPPMRLTVIGVMDARTTIGRGLYATAGTLRTAGWTPPPPDHYYFTVAPGVTPRAAAQGLSRSFAAEGLAATVLDEQVRATQGIRTLLNQLLTAFMALGLVSGVVALGVTASRAVVERRQQIGVLRAIGFRRGPVALTFVLESSLIAWLGIAIGVAAGIVLARNVIGLLAGDNPEIAFGVPWLQLALLALAAYGATLLMTIVPALRAARVHPSQALRSE